MQSAPGTYPTMLLDLSPVSLWDRDIITWCQQLKEVSPDLPERLESPPQQAQEHTQEPASHLGDGQKSVHDDFAFNMTAFEAKPPVLEPGQSAVANSQADPFAFDATAFGTGATSATEKDPYAFDASQFGQEPGLEFKEKPQSLSQPAADPFAFDASAFGMGAQVEKDPYAFDAAQFGQQSEAKEKPGSSVSNAADPFAFDASAFQPPSQPDRAAAGDPFAFNMEAFQDQPETAHESAQPKAHQSRDPFAFDMGAFEPPHSKAGVASDEDMPMKGRGRIQQPQAPASICSTDLRSSAAEPYQQPVKEHHQPRVTRQSSAPVSKKQPKAVFQPLTPAQLSELRERLLPKSTGDASDTSNSDSVSEEQSPGKANGANGCCMDREVMEEVVRVAKTVTSGLPASIADASAFDNAAQHAASSFQVLSSCLP